VIDYGHYITNQLRSRQAAVHSRGRADPRRAASCEKRKSRPCPARQPWTPSSAVTVVRDMTSHFGAVGI
jgi:hypothetical protein